MILTAAQLNLIVWQTMSSWTSFISRKALIQGIKPEQPGLPRVQPTCPASLDRHQTEHLKDTLLRRQMTCSAWWRNQEGHVDLPACQRLADNWREVWTGRQTKAVTALPVMEEPQFLFTRGTPKQLAKERRSVCHTYLTPPPLSRAPVYQLGTLSCRTTLTLAAVGSSLLERGL